MVFKISDTQGEITMKKLADSLIKSKSGELAEWEVREVGKEKRLTRVFTFGDFIAAMAFTVKPKLIDLQ